MTREPLTRLISILVAGTARIAAAVSVAGQAPAKKVEHVGCTLHLNAIIKQPAPTAANFGTASCDNEFGEGVDHDSSTTTRTSPLTGHFTGPWKLYFDEGTVSGILTINFVTTVGGSPPAITGVTYDGTLQVTGATGRYKHVRGTGTVTGFSPDAVKTQLDEVFTLTGV